MKVYYLPVFLLLVGLYSCTQKDLRAQYYFIRSAATGDTIARFYVHETEDAAVRMEFTLKNLRSDTLYAAMLRKGKTNAPTDTLMSWELQRTTGTTLKFEKTASYTFDEFRVMDASFFLYGPYPLLTTKVAIANLGKNR
jgi:hypothetical protein